MYSKFNCPIKLSIFLYTLIVLLLLYHKPELIFTDEGTTKGFGCDTECEFFNLPVILYSSVIIITFIFETISISIENNN